LQFGICALGRSFRRFLALSMGLLVVWFGSQAK
jgi:hypothetical protein